MFKFARSTSCALRHLGQAAAVATACLIGAAPAQATSIDYRGFLQCRNAPVTEFPGTIVEAAIATPQLSTLVSLVKAADLVGALSSKGPFTVFAPNDEAFGKVPAPLLSLIGGDPALLGKVLTYHVTAGTVDPRRYLTPMSVKTLQGQPLYIGYSAGGGTVNQSSAGCKGVKTTNGVVWLVDSVLLPQFK